MESTPATPPGCSRAAALVLLMTPGLAFFYGGMVRIKSVLNMMMMSFACIGVVEHPVGALRLLARLRTGTNPFIGTFEAAGLSGTIDAVQLVPTPASWRSWPSS